MKIIFLLILFVAQYAEAQDKINEIFFLETPNNAVSLEQLAKNIDQFPWLKSANRVGFMVRAHHDIYFRFKAPESASDSYVAQFPFRTTTPETSDYNLQGYVLIGEELRPLAKVVDRFATFRIDRSIYGQTILLKTPIGPFPAGHMIDLKILGTEEHQVLTQRDMGFFGFICGIIAIMTIYNLGLLTLFRKLYLVYYTFYTTAALYWFLLENCILGFNSNLVLSFHIVVEIIHISTVLFSFSVLGAEKKYSRHFYVCKFLIAISLCMLVGIILGSTVAVEIFYLLMPLSFFLCFLLAVRASFEGDPSAKLMVIGWAGLVIGLIFNTAAIFLGDFPYTNWSAPIAVAVEIAIFSFAIGKKLRMSELQARQENEHAFGEMSKMIYAHQLNRIRRGEHLEVTMPTHTTEAIVISFDLIGSSQIDSKQAKIFFRHVFAQCNVIMAEGYDGKELKARAYRIKEMGDGFLCSIGYPFTSFSDHPAHEAIDLAKRFARVVEDEAKLLALNQPIACGIGIAYESITGFYPETGTKEYDLYGPSIVLATRYEGMRKILFEDQNDRSILIIQNRVFQMLDADHQNQFQRLNLKQHGVVVRDDPNADSLAFLFLTESKLPSPRISRRPFSQKISSK